MNGADEAGGSGRYAGQEGEAGRRDAVVELGSVLSGAQARAVAASLEAGETLTQALGAVEASRRRRVRELMGRAGLGTLERERTAAVLRAIEGALAHPTSVTPVWTVPGGPGAFGVTGHLTGLIHELVTRAYGAVTCSTYNIARSSALWEALKEVAARPEVSVRLYLDTDVADAEPKPWVPTTAQVARELKGAVVMRTRAGEDGKRPRNHAKFVVVDHQIVVVTSANMSRSAEERNVELGLRLDEPLLARAIEDQMRALEPHVYERVAG
ncbi:DISARM system phospholipase D-like protein DrmC [Actinomyces succiniciruminis]|uniref:Phospholipase D/transphosphatidylase n=1 Tax=Actinomyces succiniciruminis TaxID=1522002 RepID=A0A1L7R9I6_9ACTO|nr:DISARM system phospholipase D-like protein DrmC [Actinomyces succiniciruminis]CED90505.1 Phospholipase D/transphosphatidylase [Actinomyces succiniciruminis]